ncbi:uncharacterized protein LOC135681326 isoform X2 [Rhopilema esculentum]|uniref:uncharacterized protein LOC135681326 isoform X2 n=1 Tax=Rhopilema esculentum TaxID=499914 RepID=UPI0031D23F22
MPVNGSDKQIRKKRINYSNSFRNQPFEIAKEPFKREDELRHSTGSTKEHHSVTYRTKTDISLKYPTKIDGRPVYNADVAMVNGQRTGSYDSQMSEKEEPGTPSHSVSHLIRGFESKTDSNSRVDSSRLLTPAFGSYEDNSEYDVTDKQKRNASKRKLSIRKRGKSNNSGNASVLQKLGIAPFMGSENRNAKKALAHFDVQSILFELENAAVLKAIYADGGSRPKNVSTGASAASMRSQKKKSDGSDSGSTEKVRTDSFTEDGDGASNDLVESCPFFCNEIGAVENQEEDKMNKLFGKFRGNMSSRVWTSMSKNRTPSLELLNSTDNDLDSIFGSGLSTSELDQKNDVTILESINEGSKISLWDRPKRSDKRIFDFQHIDLGAMYYREFFIGKDHQNYLGIDEKYGPICITIARENLEKMAVLGHPKELTKSSSHKYQYRIILRTTELSTFRGAVLEESIPSTTRHGASRALPPRDILEFCFPELQISCLKLAMAGPKVPEHLQKLDEQQLSLQYKVGLLYCKAGQSSEEDMYNNEHHGPAFDEFMDVIGEKVFLKGFEGYRAQLDNKNDSTGTYSLYTKFQNREIMFHVSTLLPWTPNNKQQLLRKRHIGNDIVTVIFQEPGAEPFTPKNIRSHFQHVFIVVRVENPNTNNAAYRVAVSRSQDVPEFGPPIPPDSTFRKNKAFRDFLLSKIINAENAAHKSEKFTAMAVRTRYEYLKDLATNFVTAQTVDSGGAKFSKFNPLSVKKREKIHPPCNPEVWCQGSLVWSVKVDAENAATSRLCFIAVSTSFIVLLDKVTKENVVTITCKSVIGWRISGYSMRLYYNNGQGLNLTLVEDDGNEMTFIVNRLKAVTPGCQTQDMSLRRSGNGQLGFHVFYEGLVAEVEPYGMAWQAGLRKGSRLLEISGRLVGKMSHDRMIQSLRKPGSIRVVVLPPLPDGQPRNYKSTRNLKRYSSMTSVYSERIQDSTDTSGSSSSRENIPLDFETVTPIRVGGQKMTTIEAIIKQSTPHSISRLNNNHSSRPQGFILDSDQSLEFTEASSAEHLITSPTHLSDGKREKILKQNKEVVAHGIGNGKEENPVPGNDKQRTPIVLKDTVSNSSSAGSVDPELTELERNITDTRKSIDAKFYKSLIQNSASRKYHDQASRGAIPSKPGASKDMKHILEHTNPIIDLHGRRTNKTTIENEPVLEEDISVLPNRVKDTPMQGKAAPPNGVQSKPSESSELINGSSASLSRMRSPPPYEVAINSLERQRAKKNQTKKEATKDIKVENAPSGASSPNHHSNDSSLDEKPRVLLRKTSSETRRHRYQVKSENLEDLLGSKNFMKGTPKTESNTLPYEFIGNRNKLMIARSESNIHASCERSLVSDNEDRHRNFDIVQTRVRDVNDVIKEKIHVRSGSADQLVGFSRLPSQSQSPSPEGGRREQLSILRGNMPRKLSRKSSVGGDSEEGTPYSSHLNRRIKSQEDIAAESEPTLGKHHAPFRQASVGSISTDSFLYTEESINDTFAKIDQAFGFTSYGDQQSTDQTASKEASKEEKRKKKSKHRQRSRSSKHFTDSSDEESGASSLASVASKRSTSSGRTRLKSFEKFKPPSQDSLEKKKSEAEESLEAAITEFHSTLSSLPDQRSSLYRSSSIEQSKNVRTPKEQSTVSVISTAGKQKSERSSVQVSRKTIAYSENKGKGYSRISSRQSSIDSPSHSSRESGGRVQELVGKFSNIERKDSLDSPTPNRGNDRTRSRSEARISLISSSSPWVRRSSYQSVSKNTEGGSIANRFERHRASHTEKVKQGSSTPEETPVKKRISVTVRPKLEMENEQEKFGRLEVAPNSPLWMDACERGMTTLPGRGKKFKKSIQNSGEIYKRETYGRT